MKISELIEKLKNIQETDGDLEVCTTESHDYWGTIYKRITDSSVSVDGAAQPEGPKSGWVAKAVVIGD